MRSISRATGLLVLAYVLLPSPSFAATPTTLYTFGPAPDGWDPEGPLAIGKNGTLYGTTEYGGAYGYEGSTLGIGYGTVFSLAPPGPRAVPGPRPQYGTSAEPQPTACTQSAG